jgi:hypothetical protein
MGASAPAAHKVTQQPPSGSTATACGRPVGSPGQQVGDRGADRAAADGVLAGQGGDADPVAVTVADLLGRPQLAVPGPAPGNLAGCPGGGEALAGELVLQVTVKLPDRDHDVDQHGGGRVARGQVGDVRQGTGEHLQLHLVALAAVAHGEDVG